MMLSLSRCDGTCSKIEQVEIHTAHTQIGLSNNRHSVMRSFSRQERYRKRYIRSAGIWRTLVFLRCHDDDYLNVTYRDSHDERMSDM